MFKIPGIPKLLVKIFLSNLLDRTSVTGLSYFAFLKFDMKNRLLSFLLLLAIIPVCISCSSVKDPEFKSIENVRVNRLGTNGTLLNLDIRYYNPNKSKLKLKQAEGDAWIEDKMLGHFTLDSMVTIFPHADFSLPVTLQVDMNNLLQHSMTLFLTPEVRIRIEGNAQQVSGR